MLDNTDRLFHYFVISLFHLRVLYEATCPTMLVVRYALGMLGTPIDWNRFPWKGPENIC